MRNAVILIILVSFVLIAMPATAGEKSLFQIAGDSITTSKASLDIKGPAKVDVFQEMSDFIAQSSAKTKPLSLRGNNEELAKRRGLK